MPPTLQVTFELPILPVTEGVNCCVWLVVTTAESLGETVTVTLGAATVRFTGVVGARLPEVPMTVSADVPVAAELVAVSVSTLVLEVLDGLNDAATPDGRPDADKATLPLKPTCGVTVIVLVTVPPWPTVGLAGAAESVKPGCWADMPPPPHPAKPSAPSKAIPSQ